MVRGNIEKNLKKEIQVFLETYAQTFCKEAAYKLTKKAKSAIEAFYAAYVPKYYDRTENLLKNSYKPYYEVISGKEIRGGVYINSEDMEEVYYGVTANYVLEAGWHGWHGTMGDDYHKHAGKLSTFFKDGQYKWGNVSPIRTFPIPIVELHKERNKLMHSKKIYKNAENAAKKGTYPLLSRFCKFK